MRLRLAMIGVLVCLPAWGAEIDDDEGSYASWAELEAAAALDDPAAQWRLAVDGDHGQVALDVVAALAAEGHCHAIEDWSAALLGAEVDDAVLRQAVSSGCGDAVAAALLEREALGYLRPRHVAPHHLTELALRGDEKAQRIACLLAARRDHPNWSYLRFCRAAAERGDVQAEFLVGRMLHGRPDDRWKQPYTWQQVTPDIRLGPDVALPHYRRAAEAGHPAAQARLARLLATGTAASKDDGQAARWAEASARQRNPEGMAVWGLLLLQGRGTASDPVRAVALIERAARAGDPTAQYSMATLLMRGRHVPRDLAKGLAWAAMPELSPLDPPPLEESEGLMLESPMRTGFNVQMAITPKLNLEARLLAAQWRKEMADSGEWPLIDEVELLITRDAWPKP